MSRLPYAAKVLIGQVRVERPHTNTDTVGRPDGLGVHRTVRFSKSGAQYLAPLLEEIDDERVTGHTWESDSLHVTFAAGPVADRKDLFPLRDAAEVVAARESATQPQEDSSLALDRERGVVTEAHPEVDDDPDRTTDLDGEPVSTGNPDE